MGAEFPATGMDLTRLLVVSDVAHSQRWYTDVLGATVHRSYGGSSVVLRILDQWLLLVASGWPTPDKPTVRMLPPEDPDRVSAEMIFGVPDCKAAFRTLSQRGARFLTPPVEYEWETRAFFRDPDGHLFEISQAKNRTAD